MKDFTVSKVDHVQSSNDNRLDSSIKNDTNCFSKKGHSQSKSNPKVKYTCSTGHDDIKGTLPENAQKSIDFDDCQIVSDNDAMDLKSISLPPKLKKRGGPKVQN